MADDRDLDTILASARAELVTLSRNGAGLSVQRAGEILDAVEASTEEWRRFIPESEARLRSGHSVEWLRGRHADWQAQGHATVRGRVRYYRACIVPRRPDLVAARLAGLRGERRANAS